MRHVTRRPAAQAKAAAVARDAQFTLYAALAALSALFSFVLLKA